MMSPSTPPGRKAAPCRWSRPSPTRWRKAAGVTAPESRFFFAGGALRPDPPSYVERLADRALYEALARREFCYVLTSRQVGKSSLIVRTAARLRHDGIQSVVLDLAGLGQNVTVEQWYLSFLET